MPAQLRRIASFMGCGSCAFAKLFKSAACPPNMPEMIDRLVREQFPIEVSMIAAL
jgi:hypothetical protein